MVSSVAGLLWLKKGVLSEVLNFWVLLDIKFSPLEPKRDTLQKYSPTEGIETVPKEERKFSRVTSPENSEFLETSNLYTPEGSGLCQRNVNLWLAGCPNSCSFVGNKSSKFSKDWTLNCLTVVKIGSPSLSVPLTLQKYVPAFEIGEEIKE
ncbi:hypothetical protein LEP1GSC170_0224, partial [Leptospira interrogans serovar Bataviae str. HAI135]